MDTFSIEDDDLGLFLTQTPSSSRNEESLTEFLDDSMDLVEMPRGEGNNRDVGQMHYSDISDDETRNKENSNQEEDFNFE